MGTKLFQTTIRECVKTKEAQDAKKLLIDYAPKCNTMLDYLSFADELLNQENHKKKRFMEQDAIFHHKNKAVKG